jgi:hypothetical protein
VQLATSSPGLLAAVNQNGPHLMEQLANVFGLHDFASAQQFMSQLAPPGTPPEHVEQLFRDIAHFSSDPREFREQLERLIMGQPENIQRPTPEPSATPTPTPTSTPGPNTPEPIDYLDVLQNMLDLLNGQPWPSQLAAAGSSPSRRPSSRGYMIVRQRTGAHLEVSFSSGHGGVPW